MSGFISENVEYYEDNYFSAEDEIRYYQFLGGQFDSHGNYIQDNESFMVNPIPYFENAVPMYILDLHNRLHSNTENTSLQLNTSKSEFPASFNPRSASDMPASERVARWIRNIPMYLDRQGNYINGCFEGVISSSGTDIASNLGDDLDIIEYQARKITQITTKNYFEDWEPVASPVKITSADYLLSQAGKVQIS